MTTVNIMSEMKIAHKRYLGVWNLCSVQWYLMSQLPSSVSKCISKYGRFRAGKSCCWQYQVAKENKFRHRHCYALNVTSPSPPLPHTDLVLNVCFLVLDVFGWMVVEH
jgi:hypothetical protein